MTVVAPWAAGLFGFWAPHLGPGDEVDGPALASNPVILWSAQLEGPPPDSASRAEPGAPVVVGNYLLVGYSVANELQVLDRRDGHRVGGFPAKGPVGAAAVSDGSRVWFTDGAGYTSCYLLDQIDGIAAWSHYSGGPIVGAPVVVDGVVYVSNVDDQVYALDARTGELRWRFEHRLDAARSASLELFGAPPPVVAGDVVYAGFSDGFLVALSRSAGNELWNASVGEGTYPDLIAPALPIGDAVLAAGFDKPLVALDTTTRAVRWRVEEGTASAVTLAGDVLYVGGSDGKLRAVGARTGDLRWTWDSLTGGTLTTPVVTPQGVLVGSGEGSLYLIDAATGVRRWQMDPGVTVVGIAAAPAVVGDHVYVLTNAGMVYGLRGPAVEPVTGTRRPAWVSPSLRR